MREFAARLAQWSIKHGSSRSRTAKSFFLFLRRFFNCQKDNATAKVNLPSPSRHRRKVLNAQARSPLAHCPENCRLLKVGRLSGVKKKQPGRAGKAQWLVNPKSIEREKQRLAKSG